LVKAALGYDYFAFASFVVPGELFLTEKTKNAARRRSARRRGKEERAEKGFSVILFGLGGNPAAEPVFGFFVQACGRGGIVGRSLAAGQPAQTVEVLLVAAAVSAHHQVEANPHPLVDRECVVHGLGNQAGDVAAIEHPHFHDQVLLR